MNKSEIARDVGVSVKAIGDWVSVLQISGQIAQLEPWFINISKRVVKTPKIYFSDCGLLRFLLNLTEETLPSSQMLGAVRETLVFSELRKRSSFIDAPVDIWFYRDQRSREIDFILDKGSELSFIEAKWQEHPADRDAKIIHIISTELLQSNTPWKPGQHYVVGTPPNTYDISDGVTAIGIANIDRMLSLTAES